MAERLVAECKSMKMDEVALEVLHGNKTAAAFWRSIGLKQADRILFNMKLNPQR